MSLHPPRVPSAAEVLAASSRPIPARIRTASFLLAVIGALVFVAGLFVNPDRVWTAFHFNWLFFAALSTAGVVFVAVQRITTARWSRAVIRFIEQHDVLIVRRYQRHYYPTNDLHKSKTS